VSAGAAPPKAPASGRAPRPRLSRAQEQRRQLLRGGLVTAGLLLLQPFAWIPIVRAWRTRLRPPGALDEKPFLGACIKCGQCVQVCPVEAIVLADADDGFGLGVPYIDPRRQACDFSCDALSCVLACPTGALSHDLKGKEDARCGVARLARPDACLARKGEPFRGIARGSDYDGRLRYEEIDRWNPLPVSSHPYDREICDLCVTECPIGDHAIRLVPLPEEEGGGRGRFTPEVHRGCVGCGVCEMICPQEPTCIVVDARATFTPLHRGRGPGRGGEHGQLDERDEEAEAT
jgi:ferredoxin-type protein NapG